MSRVAHRLVRRRLSGCDGALQTRDPGGGTACTQLTCMFSSGWDGRNQNSAATSGNALAPTFLTYTHPARNLARMLVRRRRVADRDPTVRHHDQSSPPGRFALMRVRASGLRRSRVPMRAVGLPGPPAKVLSHTTYERRRD